MNEAAVTYLKCKDERLAKVIETIGELEIHNYTDSFRFLVREIVGQMVSAAVKNVIFGRLEIICGNNISPEVISNLRPEDLRAIGLSNAKATFIHDLGKKVVCGEISFDALAESSDEEVMNSLTSIKGIGSWTAKMYLLFFLRREDILPYEDVAFMQAYRWLYNSRKTDKTSVLNRCKKWKPYSSVAARYLYRALDTGLTKLPIKLFLSGETLSM